MKIKCLHGYFEFEESGVGEISNFMSLYGLNLVRIGDRFTFEGLEDAPSYSIGGAPYLNLVASADFAGKPWEVFKANEFVFDYDKGLLVPIDSVTQIVTIDQAGNYFMTNGLIKPGSLTPAGDRVESYIGWYSDARLRFRYSEVTYVE